MLYPANIESKIDFESVRIHLQNSCISELGKDKVEKLSFSTDYESIQQLLSQTDEMVRILSNTDEVLPVGDFFDLREGLSRIRVEGLFFDESEVFELRRALEAVRKVVDFIRKKEVEQFPQLHALITGVSLFPDLIRRIDSILDKFGKIKDNASHDLASIRRQLMQAQSSASRTLHQILRKAQSDGYVDKDLSPTLREGRLVIPVSPAFKRKLSGIVHDESASGKTVFIEPAEVVEANNRIRELEGEERREIIRILTEFTGFVRPYTDEILDSQFFLGEIDFVRAKAQFALKINAIRPRIDSLCQLEWRQAVHPLLYLSLQKQGKSVVPLDIQLNSNQRILLISGPNAGGKSVCLKTVVLLQYMLQCGLLIPIHPDSRCGIFSRIFIDIGDEQSIENDLSTYSSHLTNMKFFVRNSTASTLLLIDEFGTGTEPMIGGAIAEATLERFNQNRAFGVITTHYTNLKHYAEDAEGIVNGAMLYDRQHLQPLFKLEIGNPGSSFAIEIARKIGLPEDLIADAAEKVGSEHLDYDKHLQDIVRDKRYWEKKRQQIRLKEKRIEELLERYETDLADINRTRKEITQKAKSEAQLLLGEANARIENTIRQIKEAQAEKEKTRTIRAELKEFRERLQTLESESIPAAQKKPNKKLSKSSVQQSGNQFRPQPYTAGMSVRLKDQSTTGVILEIQDKLAIVAFGNLKSTVQLSRLEPLSQNQLKKEQKKIHAVSTVTEEVRSRKLSFKSEIDLRGMRADEALQAVTYYIDDALMVGISAVRILHGTGTGALRQIIRQYLSTVPGVKQFRDEHVQFGGAGITVVDLEE
ncbi:MAG: endonuclease MutS2 [Paludibacter sp.]|nr:endonuclease MutS2 [Paludibacter sp.]